jgi:hypothetical protein
MRLSPAILPRLGRLAGLAAGALLLCASAGAAGQSADVTAPGMPGEDDAASPAIDQISYGPRLVAAPRPLQEEPGASQLTARGAGDPATNQLTSDRRPARAQDQLYRGGRDAQASAPLSRPSQGRTGAVARVGGADRCDPQAESRGERPRNCAQVIETRSAEFPTSEPAQLSAEQRLLIEQQNRSRNSIQSAVQRAGHGEVDPDRAEDQAVASIVLPEQPSQARSEQQPAEDANSATAAAIVDAIISRQTAPQ